MVKKEYVTWDDVEDFIRRLKIYYEGELPLNGVYGLPRGGLVLAVMISHRMRLPLLAAPCPGCLIVDDICDSGESLLHYTANSSSLDKLPYNIATMYYKKNELNVEPDFYGYAKDDKWIVFPWESMED